MYLFDLAADKIERTTDCVDFESINAIEPSPKDASLLYFCGPTNEDFGGVATWDCRTEEGVVQKYGYRSKLPHDIRCNLKGSEFAVCDETGSLFVTI